MENEDLGSILNCLYIYRVVAYTPEYLMYTSSSCIMHSSWKGKYAMNKREEYTFSDKCIRNQEEALNCFIATCNLDDLGNAIDIFYSTEAENEFYIYLDSNI